MIYIAFPFLLFFFFLFSPSFLFTHHRTDGLRLLHHTEKPNHSGIAWFHARSEFPLLYLCAPPENVKLPTNCCKCRTRLFDITHTVSIPFCLSTVSLYLVLPHPPPHPHITPRAIHTVSYIYIRFTHIRGRGFHWLPHFRTR